METTDISRRRLLKGSGAAWAGLNMLQVAGPSQAFAQAGGDVIPWLDQPGTNLNPMNVWNLLKWEDLNTWLTPAQSFVNIKHYEMPTISEANWRLNVTGLVRRPL